MIQILLVSINVLLFLYYKNETFRFVFAYTFDSNNQINNNLCFQCQNNKIPIYRV